MIERILFPTDGSPLSDRALPVLELVAAAQGSKVYVVQVVPPPVWAGAEGVGYGADTGISVELYEQLLEELDRQAQDNTARLVQRLQSHSPRIDATARVFRGTPYAGLLDVEQELKPDLVIMATHGRTGLARFVRGSVADCMVREGTAPVLLVRSFGHEVTALQRALVPLDGSAVAEAALPMIEALAHKPVESIRLLRAVERTYEKSEAGAYLHRIARRLQPAQLDVTEEVAVGAPEALIVEAAETADIVIMATHGRSGLNRLRHGSVAEHALRETPVPLLLVRAGQA